MTVRSLTITNTYGDDEVINVAEVDIDGDRYVNDAAYREQMDNETLYALTGTGRRADPATGRTPDACYTVESNDDLDPPINLEWIG